MHDTLFSLLRTTVAPAIALFLLAGCGDDEPRYVGETREGPARSAPAPSGMNPHERMGIGSDPHAGMPGFPSSGAAQKPALPYAFEVPDGWHTLPPMQFVDAAFSVDGHPRARVTLSRAAGTFLDNINRWRGQMGLPGIGEADLAKLPRRKVLEHEALEVDLQGSFQGMRGSALPDARMLGLIVPTPGQSTFVKFLAPKHIVERDHEKFFAFAKSLAPIGASTHSTAGNNLGKARTQKPTPPIKLSWTLPESWRALPSNPPRLATFQPKEAKDAQCLVTVLKGSGGGVAANLNEWRRQLGQAPLTDPEYLALERKQLMGTNAIFIDVEGDVTPTQGAAALPARLYGAILPRNEDTIFVKMWGPKEELEGERENFHALLDSLRE